MKLSGLRALMVVTCVVALFSMMAVADLEHIAANELIPEISAAAGLALASSWAEITTEAQLEDLAVTGRTIGLRTAASEALSILYFAKTGEELIAILISDLDPMIRAAAIAPAKMYLSAMTREDVEDFVLADYLKELATTGETHEMRLAAARAHYFVIRRTLPFALDELKAAADGGTELAIAAGEVLGGFYLFHPVLGKTQAELVDLAIGAGSAGLRTAAATALAVLLIQSDETAVSLQTTMLEIFGAGSVEHRNAYKFALAHRFGL